MTKAGKTIQKGVVLNHDDMKILRVVRRFPLHREYPSGEREHLHKGLVISLEKNSHSGDWIGDEVWGNNVWSQLIKHQYGYPIENALILPANEIGDGIRGTYSWDKISKEEIAAIRESRMYWLNFKATPNTPEGAIYSGPLSVDYREDRLRWFNQTGAYLSYSERKNITRPIFSIHGKFFYTPQIWNSETYTYEEHYESSHHKEEKYSYKGFEHLSAYLLNLYDYWIQRFGIVCIQACPGFFPESEAPQDTLSTLESIAQAIEKKSVSG